jgi:hypothetical protein
MAITKGKFTLTSTDLTSDQINFNVEQECKTAPYSDGCDSTSGLARVTIASGGAFTFDTDDKFIRKSIASTTPGTNWHKNYLYVKNVNTTNVTLKVTIDSSTYLPSLEGCTSCDMVIAMLEKDDWLQFPWTANVDLKVQAVSSDDCLMEYMIIN